MKVPSEVLDDILNSTSGREDRSFLLLQFIAKILVMIYEILEKYLDNS